MCTQDTSEAEAEEEELLTQAAGEPKTEEEEMTHVRDDSTDPGADQDPSEDLPDTHNTNPYKDHK